MGVGWIPDIVQVFFTHSHLFIYNQGQLILHLCNCSIPKGLSQLELYRRKGKKNNTPLCILFYVALDLKGQGINVGVPFTSAGEF